MATIDLGKIKLVWRGTYSGGTAYTVDDVVQHTDSGLTSSFICTTNSTGNAPSTGGSVHSSWAYLAKGGAAGTDVGTTITTQGDILYRDGSGLQRLAKPASDKFLQNTSGGVLSWEAVSSDCVKLSTVNAAGAADIYMDNVFSDTYKYYKFVYGGVKFSSHTSGAWLRIGFRTGGASGANVGGTYYKKDRELYGGETGQSNNTGAHQSDSVGVQIWNTWNLQTDGSPSATSSDTTYAPYRAGGVLEFFWPTQANWKPSFHYKSQFNDNGHVGTSEGIGYNDTKISSGGITGLRINSEGHNIAAGFFTLYGFKL